MVEVSPRKPSGVEQSHKLRCVINLGGRFQYWLRLGPPDYSVSGDAKETRCRTPPPYTAEPEHSLNNAFSVVRTFRGGLPQPPGNVHELPARAQRMGRLHYVPHTKFYC